MKTITWLAALAGAVLALHEADTEISPRSNCSAGLCLREFSHPWLPHAPDNDAQRLPVARTLAAQEASVTSVEPTILFELAPRG